MQDLMDVLVCNVQCRTSVAHIDGEEAIEAAVNDLVLATAPRLRVDYSRNAPLLEVNSVSCFG